MKPVRSVLIVDVDNTLFDWVHVWYAAFSAMFDELVRLSGITPERLLPAIRAVHQKVGTSEYAFLIGGVPMLAPAAGSVPLLDYYAPAVAAYRAARQQALEFYPGVEPFLEELRKHGTLVVCYTESLAYYTQYRFRKLGLDSLVDYLYSPADHPLPEGVSREEIRYYSPEHYQLEHTVHRVTPAGEMKPNPMILRSILADLDISAGQAIYVGDNLHKDVWMAQQAGVLDAHAAYGAKHDSKEYALLRQVSHWTEADVARERQLDTEGGVAPSITLQRLGDLTEHVEFEAFQGAAAT
jgi:phosphoglycolate phosphatase